MKLDIERYVPEIVDAEYPTISAIADETLARLVDETLVVSDPAVQKYLDRHVDRYDVDGWFDADDVAAAVADALTASAIAANRYAGGYPVSPACEAEGADFIVKIFPDGSIVEEDRGGICLVVRDIDEYERLRGPLAEELAAY